MTFSAVIEGLFPRLRTPLPPESVERLRSWSTVDREVMLAIWSPILETPAIETAAMVDAVLAGLRVPYLSVLGIDPGPRDASWLAERVPPAVCEVWDGLGHYLHWMEPERIAERLRRFWRESN